MRAALLVALLLLLAARAHADEVVGYDHVIHDGYVEVKGLEAPDCAHCHGLDRTLAPAKPGHAACFGGACHAMPAKPNVAPVPAKLCLACHDTPQPRKGARTLWAGEISRDFGLNFPHDRHARVTHAPGRSGCLECHVAPSATRAAATKPAAAKPSAAKPSATKVGGAHARCIGCHGTSGSLAAPGVPFPIGACAACHRSIAGRFDAPAQVKSPYAVGATFSHDSHLPRVPGAPAARCATCHAEVDATSGPLVPAPAMATCEACHDGKKAFATLGTTCRKCHTRGDALPAAEPVRRFDHARHQALGGASGDAASRCEGCHVREASGLALRPVDHTTCAAATCHADDFRTRAPRLCGGCHVGTEPWRPLRADAERRARSEFGAEFSHRDHLGGKDPRIQRSCASCHTGVRGGLPVRLGQGHASCAGEACHDRRAPALADCTGCHRLGVLPERDAARDSRRWSVAARFDHPRHANDPQGRPLACERCHEGVLVARRVAEIPVPKKAACAGCHDGAIAFKMTGTGCGRCHQHGAADATP